MIAVLVRTCRTILQRNTALAMVIAATWRAVKDPSANTLTGELALVAARPNSMVRAFAGAATLELLASILILSLVMTTAVPILTGPVLATLHSMDQTASIQTSTLAVVEVRPTLMEPAFAMLV